MGAPRRSRTAKGKSKAAQSAATASPPRSASAASPPRSARPPVNARRAWLNNKNTALTWLGNTWTPYQKQLIANPMSGLYKNPKFNEERIPRGFPLRLLHPGHALHNKNGNSTVQSVNANNAPSRNFKPNSPAAKRNIIRNKIRTIDTLFSQTKNVSKFSKFLANRLITGAGTLSKNSGRRNTTANEYAKFVQMIINLVNEYQTIKKSDISSSEITAIAKGVEINFKKINDVCIFLIIIFCDYLHDLKKSIVEVGARVGVRTDGLSQADVIKNVFSGWVHHVSWLNPVIKNAFTRSMGNVEWNILTRCFSGNSVDEDKVKSTMLAWMKYDNDKRPLPFLIARIGLFRRLAGGPSPHISFDQTSKASGPAFYASADKSFKIDIALPMIADEGSSQASNPYLEFRAHFTKLFKLFNQPVIPREVVYDEIRKLASRFTINANERFEVRFKLGEEYITKYVYYLDESNDVKVDFKAFNGVPGINGSILSATGIAHADPSVAILKTCADIGIIAYGIGAGSISTTGDRAASINALLFTYLSSRRRLDMRGSLNKTRLFNRSIFESGPGEVIISAYPRWTEAPRNLPRNIKEERLNVNANINFGAPVVIRNVVNARLGIPATAAAVSRLAVIANRGFNLFNRSRLVNPTTGRPIMSKRKANSPIVPLSVPVTKSRKPKRRPNSNN